MYAAIILALVFCAFIGWRYGKNIQNFLNKYPSAPKAAVCIYTTFTACCLFPLSAKASHSYFLKTYILFACYITVAYGFAFAFKADMDMHKKVYALSLLSTAIGLLCRYFIEFGEVSNTYNFTLNNIFSYIIIVPSAITFVYCIATKHIKSKGI